jgi:Protein of unknown function (DUF2868)
MHAHDLRRILLVQAIEECDAKGELLTFAARAAATQAALREKSDAAQAFAGDALSAAGERLLLRRARELEESVRLRAPIVERLHALSVGAGRRDGLLVLALLAGLVLAALDGHSYIDILGASLLALLAWNLSVYALGAANLVRPRAQSGAGIAGLYARWLGRRAALVLKRSRSFNAPLAAALPRFSSEWGTLARALVLQRATRLFHICAALVVLGLVVGLCVRGFVLRDAAGWSSSLLGAGAVRWLLSLLYAPAAAIAGVALPTTAADVEALHVASGVGGAKPATWIYLIALTMTFYIIVPRLLGAAAASVRLWQIARNMPVPVSVVPYARHTFIAPEDIVKDHDPGAASD